MAELSIIVVTPEATVVDAKADFVAVPFYDGEVGVAANHAPLIGRLGYGELRFEDGGQLVRYFIDGGFVQIADNVVSIMADRAIPSGDIDASEAQDQIVATAAEPASLDQIDEREKRVARARAMMRVAQNDPLAVRR